MTALAEQNSWDAVPQIETDTVWKGGPDGPANDQGKALANRTAWLKALAESLGTDKLDLAALASQAEAEAGADDTKWMSPLKTAQAVAVAVAALVDSSPATLDTLNELATALGDDPNFAATMTAALANKLAIADFQKSAPTFAIATGTADAITAAYTPAITTDTAGRIPQVTLAFVATAANTGAGTTLDVGTGAFGLIKGAGLPIVAGDIDGAGSVVVVRGLRGADATGDKWVQLNPATGVSAPVSLASSATTKSGTSTTEAVTPKGLADSVLGGVGTAVHNETGSRSLGATYYNTSDRPMLLVVTTYCSTQLAVATLTVNGEVASKTAQPSAGYCDIHIAIVLPGWPYSISQAGSGATIFNWAETF